MIKLDLKDRKVLYELDFNARQSNSEIAKKVGINKNTVNYKIGRLAKEGVILGYYCVIDSSKLGYFSFRVYINFFNTSPEKEKEIISWLKNNKLVGVIARIENIYDISFMAWVKNIYEFEEFWIEFKKKFRSFIWNEKIHVFSRVDHFKRKYILEKKKYEYYESIGGIKIIKYDDLDLKILRLLAQNARIPLIDLSKRLNIPPRTIAFRIKQLEKNGVIRGYRVNINLEKIGYEYYKLNIILNNFDKYEELLEFAKGNPNIIYINKTLSNLDFEIDVEIENRKELMNLIEEIKSKFNIRDIEILIYKEYEKLESLPE